MDNGRTAVITGGSRGIGRAVALKLAENGINVAIVYNGRIESAQDVVNKALELGVDAGCYRCDVADFEASAAICNQIIADFGRVDILVNNAGITKDMLFMRMTESDFDRVIDVNLKGAFNFTRHLSKSIIRSDFGRIINISSVSGLMGNPGQANYSASKAGLIGFTKTVAKELAGRNVTCNAIAPGFIETEMTEHLPESVKGKLDSVVPLKRMGRADEVAFLALFLASEMSGYITGEVIRIDGGMCM